jgi:DNA repair protein RecO (recombination protein O)
MPRTKTRAIILNTRDYSESDRIIIMLSPNMGLINAIAKGARKSTKRFPGTLEPFSEIEAELYIKPGIELFRIEEAKLVNANLWAREDLNLFAHASILLEIPAVNLAPLDPHPQVFDVLIKSLACFSPEKKWFCFWASALTGILKSLGYGFNVKEALIKGEPLPMTGMSGEAVMFMERACMLDPELLSRLHVSARAKNEISQFLFELCEQVSHRPLKTIEFLKGLS